MRSSPVVHGLSALALAILVGAAMAACSSSSEVPAGASDAPIASVASPIINGNLDTTHEAVVALILEKGTQGGLCSGSIIKVDAASHVGWVLTAAHCVNDVPPVYVFQGDDYSQATGTLRYTVIDYVADPGYTNVVGSTHDFAIVRIAGVDATTPTLPLVSANDGLLNGSFVVSVGYGRTSLISTGDGAPNSIRRNVSKTLNQLTDAQIGFDMALDGICQGDSGGPVLFTVGGVERIAGVHSFVNGDCNGEGVSGRVSFDLSWINTQLATAVPPDSCTLCSQISDSGKGLCAEMTAACFADADCKALNDCVAAGASVASCAAKFPKGEGPFDATADCACDSACAAQCGKTPSCLALPKCVYKFPTDSCGTCSEGACCAQSIACAGDGTCFHCLQDGNAEPECATNALRTALASCVSTSCSAPCGTPSTDPGSDADGGDPAGGSSSGTTTTTKSGCAATSTPLPGPHGLGLVALSGVVALALRRRRRA